MHLLTKLSLAAGFSSVIAFSASAEIIVSDGKTAGDNLISTDTETSLQ